VLVQKYESRGKKRTKKGKKDLVVGGSAESKCGIQLEVVYPPPPGGLGFVGGTREERTWSRAGLRA